MNSFVLDTNILSLYQDGHPVVVQNILARPIADLAITVISIEEQLGGWYTRLRRAKQRDELAHVYARLSAAVELLAGFTVLPYTLQAMDRYDQLRAANRNIGKNDLRIAAIVLESNDTLVTQNVRDFKAIPSLPIVDWSK